MGRGEGQHKPQQTPRRLYDAATAVEDPFALTMPDESSEDEDRWITLGMAATGDLLVVVWTWRAEVVRLISARPAIPRERRQYEEQK